MMTRSAEPKYNGIFMKCRSPASDDRRSAEVEVHRAVALAIDDLAHVLEHGDEVGDGLVLLEIGNDGGSLAVR